MKPTTVLSFMQACGLVNHHEMAKGACFAFQRNEEELSSLRTWIARGKRVANWVRPDV